MKSEIKFTKSEVDDVLYDVDTTETHMNPYHDVGYIEHYKNRYIFIPSGNVGLTTENLKIITKFMENLKKEIK